MNLSEYDVVVNSSATEFSETGLDQGLLFPWQILKQNRMYELPVNNVPTLDDLGESPVTRVQGFLKTLKKEMDEGLEVLAVLCFREWMLRSVTITDDAITGLVQKMGITDEKASERVIAFMRHAVQYGDLVELDRQILVMIADWHADMNVFIRSESLKYGVPHESILACVMGSNFTKLGADGKPIKDENGKFLKGPNFVAPEGHIYATMFESDTLFEEAAAAQEKMNRINAIALPVLLDPMSSVFEAEADAQSDAGEVYDDSDEDEGDEPAPVPSVSMDVAEEPEEEEIPESQDPKNLFGE